MCQACQECARTRDQECDWLQGRPQPVQPKPGALARKRYERQQAQSSLQQAERHFAPHSQAAGAASQPLTIQQPSTLHEVQHQSVLAEAQHHQHPSTPYRPPSPAILRQLAVHRTQRASIYNGAEDTFLANIKASHEREYATIKQSAEYLFTTIMRLRVEHDSNVRQWPASTDEWTPWLYRREQEETRSVDCTIRTTLGREEKVRQDAYAAYLAVLNTSFNPPTPAQAHAVRAFSQLLMISLCLRDTLTSSVCSSSAGSSISATSTAQCTGTNASCVACPFVRWLSLKAAYRLRTAAQHHEYDTRPPSAGPSDLQHPYYGQR